MTNDEPTNIVLMLCHYVAKHIFEGTTEKYMFLRLHDVGVNAYLTLNITEPFYHKVLTALASQKPTSTSYFIALIAGRVSAIAGGLIYGYSMINSNSKHSRILILLGALSGVLLHIKTRGKKKW